MTVELAAGDLLKCQKVDALVNTVNCVGVMGKGIALQFKRKWPQNFKFYADACKRGEVRPGRMLMFPLGELATPKFIINFPTKDHWKGKSKIEFISSGLEDLKQQIRAHGIKSLALPPLGAGNGGLPWPQVRHAIEEAFSCMPDVTVYLFEPNGAPDAKLMDTRTSPPNMTPVRAAIVYLLTVYGELGYGLSKLEVQKLVYFLAAAGRALPKVSFEKNVYGPYSDTLRHVLQAMEGHFIRGLGDGASDADIEPVPEALIEAQEFLDATEDFAIRDQVERVSALIDGFQNPYGLELLSTVHWVAQELGGEVDDDAVVQGVRSWITRKAQMFPAPHIKAALRRLKHGAWI